MDIFYKGKKTYIVAALLAVLGCLFMVAFPQVTVLSAQKGISLWASSVLPALLPFFICANFLNNLGVTERLRPSIFPFVMSVISGYPMGAKIIGDMRRNGQISLTEAKRLLSFCSTSGPSFMIGAVGVGMLGSPAAGIVIAVSHFGGALLNGLVFSLYWKNKEGSPRNKVTVKNPMDKGHQESDLLENLTDSMVSAFKSLGIILAYLVLFMFLTDIIQFAGILNVVDAPFEKAILKGILEMTVGCAALAPAAITLSWKCIFCSFLVSFGGLSIIGQSMSMISGLKIPLGYFIFTKVCHGVFAAILAFILALFVV